MVVVKNEVSRERSPNRSKALKMWIDSGREMKLKDIAIKLGVSDSTIRKWKALDKWDEIPEKRKRGGQAGNKNAKGNKGGSGGPPGNDKAVTHGFFRKFMPQNPEFIEIMDAVQEMDPVDMIWYNITTQFQAIVWAQRIMFVENKQEMIKELKKVEYEIHNTGTKKEKKLEQVAIKEEYEFQFSWDRYATYLKAQSAAMSELRGAIKQFLAIAPEEDERRIKLDQMQAQVEKTRLQIEELKNGKGDSEEDLIDDWVEAVMDDGKENGELNKTDGGIQEEDASVPKES
ncbi:phage terminase small subunit [Paenibacillus polymyxa]|uniref:phage terminase small subunit n=1 Tax=Paenibacillus polymyxa TaxID=1406 RepID=UPI002ED4DFAE